MFQKPRLIASLKAKSVLLHSSKLGSVSLSYPCRWSFASPVFWHISKNYSIWVSHVSHTHLLPLTTHLYNWSKQSLRKLSYSRLRSPSFLMSNYRQFIYSLLHGKRQLWIIFWDCLGGDIIKEMMHGVLRETSPSLFEGWASWNSMRAAARQLPPIQSLILRNFSPQATLFSN